MNTGIQEAANLGWKLALVAKGIADEALLDTYEIERRPIGRFVLRFTDRADRIATSESRTLRLLRTELMPRVGGTARVAIFQGASVRLPHGRTTPHPVPTQPGRARRRTGSQARAEGRRPSP